MTVLHLTSSSRQLLRTRLATLAWEPVLVAGLALLALVLRRYHLGYQSLWFDEADMVARASAPLAELLAAFVRPGENGPLYTLLLHVWIRAFGDSETAVRAPAMLAGALAVPALYLLARRIGGTLPALLAAGLLAISPYHIWYSQEAKMYAPLTLLVVLSSLLLLQALERGGRVRWAGYVICTILAIYTHLAAALLLPAHALYLAVRPRGHPQGRKAAWIALGLLALAYLPLAGWQVTIWLGGGDVSTWYPTADLPSIALIMLARFGANRGPEPSATAGVLAFALAAGAGLALARPSRLLLSALVGVPLLGFYLLTLRYPLFEDRYLIVILPPVLILAGVGLQRLGARAPLLAVGLGAIVVGAQIAALVNTNYSPAPQKEDWRGVAAYLSAHWRPTDVLIVQPGYLRTAIDYYLRHQHSPALASVQTVPSLTTDGFGARELDTALHEAGRDRERAWLLISEPRARVADPRNWLFEWFYYNFPTYDVRVFNGLKLYGYSFNSPLGVSSPRPSRGVDGAFGPVQFNGFDYHGRGSRGDEAPTGSYFPLTLYWEGRQPLDRDYIIDLRIVDAGGSAVSTRHIGPLDGYLPTSTWHPSAPVLDYHDLFIRDDVPPGQYRVELRVQDPSTGAYLPFRGQDPASGGEALRLDPIQVVPQHAAPDH